LTGVGLGAYQAMYFLAVAEVGVTVATVVSLGLAPVLTTIWEAARARRMPRLPKLAILLAATTGLVLVSLSTDGSIGAGPRSFLGLLAAVGSGTSYAATTLLSRRISQDMSSWDLTAVSTTVGAFTLAPAALMLGVGFSPSPSSVGWLVYLGVVTTALAYALFYSGLRTTTGSVAAVLTLLEPLTAALLAVVVLHEPLSARTLLGGLLMLCALAALYLAPDPPSGRMGAFDI
jgi:DME family drug/metabolite transporter